MHLRDLVWFALLLALLPSDGAAAPGHDGEAPSQSGSTSDTFKKNKNRVKREQQLANAKKGVNRSTRIAGNERKDSASARRRTTRKGRGERYPAMRLEQVNAREKLKIRLYDQRGRMRKPALKVLTRFMRCLRTGRQHSIDRRLLTLLYKVSQQYPDKVIRVYSAFRVPRKPVRGISRHGTGRAIDFQVAGVRNQVLRDYLRRSFTKVGVGYYPKVPFVHLDVREKRSAFWVDVSGSGEDALYVSNPLGYIRDERRGKTSRFTRPGPTDRTAPSQPAVTSAPPPEADPEEGADISTPSMPTTRPSDRASSEAGSSSPSGPPATDEPVPGPPPLGPGME